MNIINKLLLRLVMLAAPLYRKMGVDVFLLEVIVSTKLVMDDRRPNAIRQKKKQNNKPVKWATLATMFFSALLGVFLLFAFTVSDTIAQMVVYFLMYTFMLASSLISDFTSVLIDVRDNYIIMPKPVNDKTIVVARLAHIFVHVCKLVLPMTLPGIITVGIMYNLYGAVLFILMAFLATLLAIFIINAVYILILKITTPQKFQSIIANFQIVFSVIIFGGYQLFPKISDRLSGMLISFSDYSLSLLIPSYWFAAGWKVLFTFSGNLQEIAGLFLCFAFPLFSMYVVVKYLAPSFNQKLSMISGSSTDSAPAITTTGKPSKAASTKDGYSRMLAKLFTGSAAERSSFLLTWKMTSRSRDFKLKVYPSMGNLLVLVAVMFVNSKGLTLENLQQGNMKARIMILGLIYMCSLMVITAAFQIAYSDKYKASWIYYVSPINNPGSLISGGIKAVLCKFCLPMITATAVTMLLLVGHGVIPNLLLGIANQLLVVGLMAYFGAKQLPFSQLQTAKQKSGGCIRSIMLSLIYLVPVAAHFMLYNFAPVLYILAVIAAAGAWYLFDSVKNMEWNKLEGEYAAD
ncbi:hypothetical protein HNQ91_000301 [Filimonas zeae]|uniref:Uncharacterized protein n=1 Tax=Filimonas zeae TaxID=1737353 RepID=A0A917ILC7_9BACT|nr:hypothetical protein [Filimonas zeae]MDR6337279.1 hypothetical protein [Filimonas zeae]GGH57837.1 hypothetical protein GCM10011379_02940 [Filimonas zeae]